MTDVPDNLRCVALRQLALAKACVPERRAAVEAIAAAQAALGPEPPPAPVLRPMDAVIEGDNVRLTLDRDAWVLSWQEAIELYAVLGHVVWPQRQTVAHQPEIQKVLDSGEALMDDGHAYLADPTAENRRDFVAAMQKLRDRIGVALGVMDAVPPAPTLERQKVTGLTREQRSTLKWLPADGAWKALKLHPPVDVSYAELFLLAKAGYAETRFGARFHEARLTPEGQRVRAELDRAP